MLLIYLLKLVEVLPKDGMSFLARCQVINDLDLFKLKWSRKSWKKVDLFYLPFCFALYAILAEFIPSLSRPRALA